MVFVTIIFSIICYYYIFIIKNICVKTYFNTNRLNWTYPILIGTTITINTFFIIYKVGAKGLGLHKTPVGVAIGVAFGSGFVCAVISIPFVAHIKQLVSGKVDNLGDVELTGADIEDRKEELNIKNDSELKRINSLHDDAEKFDKKTEYAFRYLQVFTAICDSFSHGANDVANAIGPFAAMYAIYTSEGRLYQKSRYGR